MSNDELCRHKLRLCTKCRVVGDAARRMSDTVNMRIAFTQWDLLANACMAFRLDDGTTDDVLYPTRKVALQYQLRPCCVFYFRNAMGGVNPFDMQTFLDMQREAYSNDRIAWVDPDSPDIIISHQTYDHLTGRVNLR